MSTIEDRWFREGKGAKRRLEGGLGLANKAGAITDADLDSADMNHMIGGMDTTNKRLYVKLDGSWRWLDVGTRQRCKVGNSLNLRLDTAIAMPVPFNQELYDRGDFFDNSPTAITGTVAKTGSSAAIVGTGTAFLTDLAVGNTVRVSGGQEDISTVATITDNTHLTLASNAGSSNSGQTLTKTKTRFVIPEDGFYEIVATIQYAANTTGNRDCLLRLNGSTTMGGVRLPISTATSAVFIGQAVVTDEFDAGDYIELMAQQSSGTQIQIPQTSYAPMMRICRLDRDFF